MFFFGGGSKYIIPSQEVVGRLELDGCFGVVGFDWGVWKVAKVKVLAMSTTTTQQILVCGV